MQFGVCTDPSNAAVLKDAGFDFLELAVGPWLVPSESEVTFLQRAKITAESLLPVRVLNCLLPATLKCVGPAVDTGALLRHVETVCGRASRIGVRAIVFGAGAARTIPDGFPRHDAEIQLLTFGKTLGETGARYGITFMVEPLNPRETNVILTVSEGALLVERVNHAHVKLLADSYHWLENDRNESALQRAASGLGHVHVATKVSRKVPGSEPCDFTGFFGALISGGYNGDISLEAGWDNMVTQATTVRRMLGELCMPRQTQPGRA